MRALDSTILREAHSFELKADTRQGASKLDSWFLFKSASSAIIPRGFNDTYLFRIENSGLIAK